MLDCPLKDVKVKEHTHFGVGCTSQKHSKCVAICRYRVVLSSCQLGISGKKHLQLVNCLHHIDLWVCLQLYFLGY